MFKNIYTSPKRITPPPLFCNFFSNNITPPCSSLFIFIGAKRPNFFFTKKIINKKCDKTHPVIFPGAERQKFFTKKILNKICDRPIQLHSLARSARNFYYISFWKFFSNNIDPPQDYLFSEAGRARTFPPHSLPPQTFWPAAGGKFLGYIGRNTFVWETKVSDFCALQKICIFYNLFRLVICCYVLWESFPADFWGALPT